MDLWWIAPHLTVAGMLDGLLPNLLVAAVTGGCAIAAVMWLAKKRWEPALQHLTTMVDREMQGAERAALALQQRAHAQAQRGHRQQASVHGAIAGVRALQNLTEELDQCATDLNHLAQLMAQETHRPGPPGIARHVVSSAKQLSMTAEQARMTYRRLQSSVSQLLAESANDEAMGEEMAQHAHELTGAVQRLRQDMHGTKSATRRPRDLHDEPPVDHRDEAPPARRDPRAEPPIGRRDPRDEMPASRRDLRDVPPPSHREPRDDMPAPRRDPRDERPRPAPPRDDRSYDDPRHADMARERSRSRADDRAREFDDAYPRDERRERDLPPHRDEPPPRRREASRPPDDSDAELAAPPRRGGNAGPTRRREPAPDVVPHRLPDITERPFRREDGSGWLSDPYPMPPRRHEDDGPRRRY